MEFLSRFLLMMVMVSCSSVGVVSSEEIVQELEPVSYNVSGVRLKSRNSAVKVSSLDSRGNSVSGSGGYIKYKKDFYILTAAHVVEHSPVALIEGNGEQIVGEVVFLDKETDTALVSIKGMFTKKPIIWSLSKRQSIGSKVVYSGYPNSVGLLTIEGRISGYLDSKTFIHSYVWMGSSGSVVLDEYGRILGVISAVNVGYDIIGIPTIIEDVGIVVQMSKVDSFLRGK